jgi:hypothetical protein
VVAHVSIVHAVSPVPIVRTDRQNPLAATGVDDRSSEMARGDDRTGVVDDSKNGTTSGLPELNDGKRE